MAPPLSDGSKTPSRNATAATAETGPHMRRLWQIRYLKPAVSDLEGGSRSANCAGRPVLTYTPRIEPFLGTGLPLLSRLTTKNPFDTGGCHPYDRQSADLSTSPACTLLHRQWRSELLHLSIRLIHIVGHQLFHHPMVDWNLWSPERSIHIQIIIIPTRCYRFLVFLTPTDALLNN